MSTHSFSHHFQGRGVKSHMGNAFWGEFSYGGGFFFSRSFLFDCKFHIFYRVSYFGSECTFLCPVPRLFHLKQVLPFKNDVIL